MTDQSINDIQLILQEPTKLTPWTESPAFLGGSISGAPNDRIAPISAYRSLERLAVLPPVRKASKIEDEDVRQAYIRMCSGDFYVRWIAVDHQDQWRFLLRANLDESADKNDFEVSLEFGESVMQQDTNEIHQIEVGFPPQSRFDDALTAKQNNIMWNRIMHHFVRSLGAKLPFKISSLACKFLLLSWSDKYFVETLDAAMMATDIALTQARQCSEIREGMESVAEALKALGNHADSARVLYEAAEMYGEGGTRLENLYGNSGCDFIVAVDYANAERSCIKALRLAYKKHGNCLNTLDESTKILMEHISCMYATWTGSTDVVKAAQNHLETTTIAIILMFLVTTASSYIVQFGPPETFDDGSTTAPFIKTKFRTTKQARRVIEEAIRIPTPRHFRATVLSCLKPTTADDFQMMIIKPIVPVYDSIKRAQQFSEIQDSASETAQEELGAAHGVMMCCCANPACQVQASPNELKMCSCKCIYYCQKSCQVTDWPAHKLECRYQDVRRKRKAAKKEKPVA